MAAEHSKYRISIRREDGSTLAIYEGDLDAGPVFGVRVDLAPVERPWEYARVDIEPLELEPGHVPRGMVFPDAAELDSCRQKRMRRGE